MRNFKKSFFYLLFIGISLSPTGLEWHAFSAGPDNRTDDLELTLEQSQALKDLKILFHREQVQFQKRIMVKRMELRTLSPEEFRGEKGEEIRGQIKFLLLQARERSLFYRREAFQVYSPEQRKKITPETDLGFHCRGWFRRGGRWGAEIGPASRP